MHDVDLVYHLAATVQTCSEPWADLDYSFTTNVAGTFEVLAAARECRVRRVLFTSSREVYGEAAACRFPNPRRSTRRTLTAQARRRVNSIAGLRGIGNGCGGAPAGERLWSRR